jgi:hypothetical protein
VEVVGAKITVVPFPTGELPQEPEYQYQAAPVPKVPPDILIVSDSPLHIDIELVTIESADIEFELTVIETLLQIVVLQIPSALTKYVMLVVGLTTKGIPFPSVKYPHEPEYQYQSAPAPAEPPEIFSIVEEPSHIVVWTEVAEITGEEFEFTVMLILMHDVVLHEPSALTKYTDE